MRVRAILLMVFVNLSLVTTAYYVGFNDGWDLRKTVEKTKLPGCVYHHTINGIDVKDED